MQAGERIGGRYVLEQRLGLGGMGEVWLAELQGAGAFRRRVVIKVLAPERRGRSRASATMLADEARVVGALHHPGIVSAMDYLETEEHGPVFVLEFVDGASLRSVLKAARRQNAVMPEALAAHIGVQVAHALARGAYRDGPDGEPLRVVHRDVAPDNVLLSRSGAVYLGDFGVARAAGSVDVKQPGAGPKGKRGYMAPEQARGEKVGAAADIFSLGRVIAEAADVGCGPALRAGDRARDRGRSRRPFRHRFRDGRSAARGLSAAERSRPRAGGVAAGEPREAMVGCKRAARAHRARSAPPPAGRPAPGDARRLERGTAALRRRAAAAAQAAEVDRDLAAALILVLPVALLFAAPRRTRRFIESRDRAAAARPPTAICGSPRARSTPRSTSTARCAG